MHEYESVKCYQSYVGFRRNNIKRLLNRITHSAKFISWQTEINKVDKDIGRGLVGNEVLNSRVGLLKFSRKNLF